MNTQNTGTAAALKRLEASELELANEVEHLKGELLKLRSEPDPSPNDTDRDSKLVIRNSRISNVIEGIGSAQDAWIKSLRALREFDKAVPRSTREGEMVSVEIAREAFSQLMLSIDLGIESCILSVAQDALRCPNEEAFYAMVGPKVRECRTNAIEVAKREGALPAWI